MRTARRSCECEKYCCLCQAVIDIRICADGLMYCEHCRKACDYKTPPTKALRSATVIDPLRRSVDFLVILVSYQWLMAFLHCAHRKSFGSRHF